MKQLLLIRHAQAGPHNQDDFNRTLTNRGINEATIVANKLKQLKLVPNYLLSSPAKRTQATANIVSKTLEIAHFSYDERIYDASIVTLIKVINEFDNKYDFVTLVGHNPGISQVIFELTGDYRDMPTAAAILIDFETNEWELVHSHTATVKQYVIPD